MVQKKICKNWRSNRCHHKKSHSWWNGKREVHRAVVVRTKKEISRRDGSKIRFDDNAAVILNSAESLEVPVYSPVTRELRETGYAHYIYGSRGVMR